LSFQFRPFTDVLRKIFGSLTPEAVGILKIAEYPPSPRSYSEQAEDVTDATMGLEKKETKKRRLRLDRVK
jgi:hypothetical protein